MIILGPSDRTMQFAEIDEGVDGGPFAAGDVKLFGQGIAERGRVKAAFNHTGKAVGIRNAQAIHRQFTEMIVVGGEYPRPWQGTISQDQLLVKPLVEIAHGCVAIRGEGSLGDTGP